jgi:hypothetical protein
MKRTKRTALPALLPNATKHGAFSKIALFPDEDQEEFQRLRSAIMDEYRPIGPSEEDAVSTILMCMWRKRRVEMYIAAKAAERQNDREQAARLALGALRLEPDSIARILRTCAPDICERIEQKFPQSNYATESEWNTAVRDHLERVLRSELIPPDGEAVCEPQPLDLTALFFAPKPSEVSDQQLIETELKANERLDAMLDRALKRFVQIRAMKQLMTSPNLHLYAPDCTPISALPTSTSRRRRGGIDQDDLD